MSTKHDPVNHPSHYTDGKIEVIDFINDKKLNFNRGNAVKCISRAGKKDASKEVEDLRKAVFYLNDEIKRLTEKDKETPVQCNACGGTGKSAYYSGDCGFCEGIGYF